MFTLMSFAASAVYLRSYCKDTNKRAKNMKLLQCFLQRTLLLQKKNRK